MPADEYSTPGGGGKLKLKGSKIADGRVEKKKKKKQKEKEKEPKKASPDADAEQQQQQQQQPDENETTTPRDTSRAPDDAADHAEESSPAAGKTEAERRHEEMRKRRLQERLKREGVKTHKERVEELNKYLSRLSEHHDMPKIGPG